jgi:Na+-translocating ferredoxin:NAD+ oxidoreductase RNF subunit RnfB
MRYLSPAATLALVVHEMDTTYSYKQYALLQSEKAVLLQKNCAECWLIGCRAGIQHIAPSNASKCLAHDRASSSETAIGKTVTDPENVADIPSGQGKIFS